ncbi:MAG: valine--tRNA ligase [Clostridia bacterium]|jgi:valyl-tRNA synthetase|nr:valine--tRNA ligase [Clostridia bacterium]
MRKELEKNYNPHSFEDRHYKKWEDNGYFHEEVDKSKKPFSIVMPPPNVTGQLHMGHALDNTIQDVMIRWRRMQGYNTLWVPGTDHASISTEVKVINKMLDDGWKRADITREAFLEEAWAWKEKYGNRIIEQLKKLGTSCDWERERFTMDEGLSYAVQDVFVKLYEAGHIYRGEKIINWCPVCQTSISDAEVEHEEHEGNFWHIKYQVVDSEEFVEIATTRPETMLGDTALAVNPKDERYAHLVGKKVVLPIVGSEIPVVADNYVDMEFGTGIVKITPAHDPNDFEVGERHDLPIINVMNDDGSINEKGGKFQGQDRYEARKNIVKELEETGHLVKIEKHDHNVGVHDRCKTVVEPMVKLQWFVAMEELAKPALKANIDGDVNFVTEKYAKVYRHWLENMKDWCVSRQLWWGHRIPAYYCNECHHIEVGHEAPEKCSKCGHSSFRQEEDVLDTWFSSALWPFSVLGWPEKTAELEHFYPTSVLVTGYDIILPWVIKMVFSGFEQMGEKPFSDVYIHGLVRDSEGRKMSKSLGNGVDPLEVIEKYGTDALRFSLITGNSPGNDMRFYWERVESSRNFANKLWNATRFIMMHMDDDADLELKNLESEDKWVLSKFNRLAKEVTDNMGTYDFGIAANKIHEFAWEELCDWYIEMVKPRLNGEEKASKDAALATLNEVLIGTLKLLHPYMPFITEEIYTTLTGEETILFAAWPEYKEENNFEAIEKEIELMKEAVRSIRNMKAEMNVAPSKKISIDVVTENAEIFTNNETFFKTLSNASEMSVKSSKEGIDDNAVSLVVEGATLYIPLGDLVDFEKEKERLSKEKEKLVKEIERVDKKLSNEGFVSKAPESVINEEKEKKVKYEEMLKQVEERLTSL